MFPDSKYAILNKAGSSNAEQPASSSMDVCAQNSGRSPTSEYIVAQTHVSAQPNVHLLK